jgi:GNAT superfamily N-acetyltransferase
MIQSCITKIAEYQRENGTRKLIRKCLIRLKNTIFFYQKEVVGCVAITDPVPRVCLNIPATIRAAEISDVPELKRITAEYKKRDFLQWINDRYIFFVAQLNNPTTRYNTSSIPMDGEADACPLPPKQLSVNVQTSGSDKTIIGYGCVCPAKKYKNKLVSMLKLQDTDYWAVDAYIHPAYRGKGVNTAIASGFLAQAKREGYKRGYGTILFKNSASRKSYAVIGEKEIGIFTTITVMGISVYRLKKNRGYEEYFN